MKVRKVKNLIFSFFFTMPLSVETQSMQAAMRTANIKRSLGDFLTTAEVGTLVQNYNANLLDDTKRFISDKPKSIPAQGFLDLSIKEPLKTYEERRDAAIMVLSHL